MTDSTPATAPNDEPTTAPVTAVPVARYGVRVVNERGVVVFEGIAGKLVMHKRSGLPTVVALIADDLAGMLEGGRTAGPSVSRLREIRQRADRLPHLSFAADRQEAKDTLVADVRWLCDQLDAAGADLAESEEYAKEGWSWVTEFCEAAGVEHVFALREFLAAARETKTANHA